MKEVYFIRIGDWGPIKIGITYSIEKRLNELQVGSPWPLRLLGAVRGSRDNERYLHEKFSHMRMEREWFQASDELLEEIAVILAPNFSWPVIKANAIDRAIELAGSQCELSTAIGISQPLISKARTTGKIGPRLAVAIHRFSNGQISASEMRPDLWGAA